MMSYDEMDLVIKLEKDSLVVLNIVIKYHTVVIKITRLPLKMVYFHE